MYKLNDTTAAVLTLDFFTPVVDDPYTFGAIAAANSLSDVFAMGAKPLTALNILSFPRCLGVSVASDVLRGGADKVKEAGAVVLGGHSIDDKEPKYGLSVFGTCNPTDLWSNSAARVGDDLFYTLPVGIGIMCAAHRVGLISEEEFSPVINAMMQLNMYAANAISEINSRHKNAVSSVTDVTGFGLCGHLHEMMLGSGASAQLNWEDIALFDKAYSLSADFCRPGKTIDLIAWANDFTRDLQDRQPAQLDAMMGVLCDPQTSGGLLLSINPDFSAEFAEIAQDNCGFKASKIGKVIQGEAGIIYL